VKTKLVVDAPPAIMCMRDGQRVIMLDCVKAKYVGVAIALNAIIIALLQISPFDMAWN
jgi:hypothetical protein